jgi:tRNA threonylcarbamoyladenosine biosynthesis protein TsaE
MHGVPTDTISASAEETSRYGASLARTLKGGDLLLLVGSLGAGKSELVRGLATALGAKRWRGSPTFNLVHEYATTPRLYHADLYRLGADDVEDLGLDEYARTDSVLAVEWADRAPDYLVTLACGETIWVVLAYLGGDRRRITVHRGRSLPSAEAAP